MYKYTSSSQNYGTFKPRNFLHIPRYFVIFLNNRGFSTRIRALHFLQANPLRTRYDKNRG